MWQRIKAADKGRFFAEKGKIKISTAVEKKALKIVFLRHFNDFMTVKKQGMSSALLMQSVKVYFLINWHARIFCVETF